jgi:hypothetical protein
VRFTDFLIILFRIPSTPVPSQLVPRTPRRHSLRLQSLSSPSRTLRAPPQMENLTKFTDAEDTSIIDWLGTPKNACKKIAVYLIAQGVSPLGVLRTHESIRQRLMAMIKKYYEAVSKKNTTGWGVDKTKKTIRGI